MSSFTLRLLLFLITLLLLAMILLATPTGLKISLQIADLLLPGKLSYQEAAGLIVNHIDIKNLNYENDDIRIHITQSHLQWQPLQLFSKHISISMLQAEGVSILLKKPEHTEKNNSSRFVNFLETALQKKQINTRTFNLPYSVDIDNLALKDIQIEKPSKQLLQFHSLNFVAHINQQHINLHLNADLEYPHPNVIALSVTGNLADCQLRLTAKSNHFLIEMGGQGSLHADHSWELKLNSNTFSVNPLLDLIEPNIQVTNDLHIQASLSGKNNNLQQGQLQIKLSPGIVKIRSTSNKIINSPNLFGDFQVFLDNDKLRTTANLQFADHNYVNLSLDMIHYDFANLLKNNPTVHGSIQARISDFSFLQADTNEIILPKETLITNLKLTGHLQTPQIEGELQFRNGKIVIPSINLALSNIQVALTTQNHVLHYHAKAFSNNTPITITGQTNLQKALLPIELTVTGNNILTVNTPEYVIYTSPNFKIILDEKSLSLDGTITVPKAMIHPYDIRNVVTLPEQDIIYVGKESSQENIPWLIKTHLNIIIEKNVQVNTSGLKGQIDGDVLLQQVPGQILLATGKVNFLNTTYTVFGHTLNIQPFSFVQFNNSPIDNPTLNVRASRNINVIDPTQVQAFVENQYLAGVQARGTFNNPKLTLFSIPATLSEENILSYLLLGQAAGGNGISKITLISQLLNTLKFGKGGLQRSGNIISKLQQGLGFSEFGIESSTMLDAIGNPVSQQTSFVIGRHVTKNIYIRFSRGISGPNPTDINTIIVRYLLGKHWAIQTNDSSQGTGGDILYTIEK